MDWIDDPDLEERLDEAASIEDKINRLTREQIEFALQYHQTQARQHQLHLELAEMEVDFWTKVLEHFNLKGE